MNDPIWQRFASGETGDGAADTAPAGSGAPAESAPAPAESLPTERLEDAALASWQALQVQAEELRQDYPDFDMAAELRDERFGLLLAGLSQAGYDGALRSAYEAAHWRQLAEQRREAALRQATARIADSIRTGLARPAESGGAAAAMMRPDPGRLTAAQVEEIRRRVMQGERVDFTS